MASRQALLLAKQWAEGQTFRPIVPLNEVADVIEQAMGAGYSFEQISRALAKLRAFTPRAIEYVLREGVIAVDTQDMTIRHEWYGTEEYEHFINWAPTDEERQDARDELAAMRRKLRGEVA